MENLKRSFIPPSHRPDVAGTMISTGVDADKKREFYKAISNDRSRREILSALMFGDQKQYPTPAWVTETFQKLFIGLKK